MAKVESPKKILSKLIRADNDTGLLKFLRSQNGKTSTNEEMLRSIISHRAKYCLYALLEKVFSLPFDALEGGLLYPLHIAAQSLWFDGTHILIEDAAEADVPRDDPANFPLSFALKAIRDNTCVSEWNHKISIYKLIYIFCLPELNEPLETVKLLASKTEQLETISLRCVLQGEVAQLTALLMVAWDKLVKPSSDQGIKGSPIGQLILNELRRFQENGVSQSYESSSKDLEHEVMLENAWKVLEILDIARDTIEECRLSCLNKLLCYLRRNLHFGSFQNSVEDLSPHLVPSSVAPCLWSKHKIFLEPEDRLADDMKCLMPRLTPKQKAYLYRSIDKEIRSVSTLPTLSERRMFETPCNSHSFHTLSPNLVKPARSGVSQACPKPGAMFSTLLRSRGIHIPRLISTLKRM